MGIFTFVLILSVSLIFYYSQNKDQKIGGKIAICKLFWLDYTLIAWFFLPIVFYFQNMKGSHFNIFYVISISMWIRGIIELYMLYVSKNWTPPIGIAHDLFTFLIATFSFYKTLPMNSSSTIISLSLLLSLILETYYAYAFYKIVKDKTTGDDAIWFASKENPKFCNILKITTFFNFIIYPILLYTIYSFTNF